jgi:3-hydroxyisobutyrate dehydrogenase-like beta-hydroxyacid dehydrogenase
VTRVGVAGLGRMGAVMVPNLAHAGFALALWNRTAAKAEQLAGEFGVSMPQTKLNLEQLRAAEGAGYGERGMAAMVEFVRGAP